MAAASDAASTPPPIAIPTSAAASALASFTPVQFFSVYLLGFRIQNSGFMMISRVCRLETSLYPRPCFLNKIIYRRRPWPRGGRLPAASAPALPCPPVSPRRAPVTDGCPQRPPPLLRSPPRHLPSRMNALSMLQPSQVLNCQNDGVASA